MRRIIAAIASLRAAPNLHQLLHGAVRPLRAIAFEKWPKSEDVARHPEPKPVYAGMRTARESAMANYPGHETARQQVLTQVESRIAAPLDGGKPPPDCHRVPQLPAAYEADPHPRDRNAELQK